MSTSRGGNKKDGSSEREKERETGEREKKRGEREGTSEPCTRRKQSTWVKGKRGGGVERYSGKTCLTWGQEGMSVKWWMDTKAPPQACKAT